MKIVYCDPMPNDVCLPLSIVEWSKDEWLVMDAGFHTRGKYKFGNYRPKYDLALVKGVKGLSESERETLKTTLPLIVMAKLTEDNYEL